MTDGIVNLPADVRFHDFERRAPVDGRVWHRAPELYENPAPKSQVAGGYPMPHLEVIDTKTQVAGGKFEKTEKPFSPELKATASPFERIKSADLSSYLRGDGTGLPPIARDFKAAALASITEKKTSELARPQIHVSTRPGDGKYPLGSEKNPYTSIQAAVVSAPEGAVVNVHRVGNDIYREPVQISRSNIILQTDANNPAVIDMQNRKSGTGEGAGVISVTSGVKNVDIRNFDIRNFSGQKSGISIDGKNISDVTVSGNNVHSARLAEGIRVYGSGTTADSANRNIKILGNEVHDIQLGELEAIPINGNVNGFKVAGNAGYRLDNIFIDAIGGEGVSANKSLDRARNGQIEYNYAAGISTKNNQNSSLSGDLSAAAIYSDGAKNLDIRNNYIVNSDFGIEVGSEHKGLNSEDCRVTGNIVQDSNFAWLGRGGDRARPGGAVNGFARGNVIIGNAYDEEQLNVRNFNLSNNAKFQTMAKVTEIPAPLSALINRRNLKQR